ncbi:small integral membrane protein 35 isoform X1 [Prinia subflava]|uniref:small integral membrane protein 35 isoform X1 n=1 Tax=Prinia subflava TaxID=208062 RepID=UPI002FE41B2D
MSCQPQRVLLLCCCFWTLPPQLSQRCCCCCQVCGCASGRLQSTHSLQLLRELCHPCASSRCQQGSCPLPVAVQVLAAPPEHPSASPAALEGRAAQEWWHGRSSSSSSEDPQALRKQPSQTSEPGLVPSPAQGGSCVTRRRGDRQDVPGLCSSSLQPGVTESSSCGTTPGHGPPDSSCRDSRLLQRPDLAHTGGPGAAARPCPSRNIAHHVSCREGRLEGREGAGQVLLLCREPREPRRPRVFVRPVRWSQCCGLQDASGPCSLCKHRDHRGSALTPLASA